MIITEYQNLPTSRKANPEIGDRYCPNSIRRKDPKIGDVIHYMEINEVYSPPEFSNADKMNRIVAIIVRDTLEEDSRRSETYKFHRLLTDLSTVDIAKISI